MTLPTTWLTGSRGRSFLVQAALVVFLGVYFFAPVTAVLDTSLDASNYAAYTRFAAEHRQFGTEVVPMAGPYGFLVYGWIYSGELSELRLVLELGTKIVFGLLVLWFFRRSGGKGASWFWLAANLLVLPTTSELTYDLCVLYGALYLVFARPRWPWTLATVFFLALLALSKGTQLVFTLAVMGLVSAEAGWRRAWGDLARLTVGFGAAVVFLWLLAGQDLAHLPAYIRNIQELSTGYVSGMALQESPRTFAVGVASLGLAALGLWLLVWPHRRQAALLTGTFLLAGFLFLEWKHGFVRADGHVFLFFHYCILAGTTALLIDRLAGAQVHAFRFRSVLCIAGTLLALYGSGESIGDRFEEYGRALARNVPVAANQIFRPEAARSRFEKKLAENRVRFALPETVGQVGNSSIGFFGYQSGYLALNHLNERPSPVAGGGPFSVFTPRLQHINEAHLLSASTRPDFYLLKLQTIDNRFIPQDDAGSLNILVHTYRPMAAERDLLLLKSAGVATVPPLRSLGRHPLRPGETVSVPAVENNEMLLVSFELPSSPSGKLRSALYKSAIVSLLLDIDGTWVTRRIIPAMAGAPFLLSPVVENTRELMTLFSNREGTRARALKFTGSPESSLQADACAVTFYAQLRPPPLDPALREEIDEQFSYPAANRRPSAVVASNARLKEVDGRLVQLLEPPGRIDFSLRGDERELLFDYGFDPEAYTRGTTDGADFIAELISPKGEVESLFFSRRDPRQVAGDRGRHRAHLWLPVLPPGMQLRLRTTGGVRGAADWDWTFYDNIRLHGGPLRIEQFPGFSRAPVSVEGTAPRMSTLDGRDILLLNAPGALAFELTGTERSLHFFGGLMPGAYTDGNTDGAEIVVELQPAAGAARTIFKRWLQPKTVPADRGTQRFDVTLPAIQAGTRLMIRTLTGPRDDGSWDWTYLADIRLENTP